MTKSRIQVRVVKSTAKAHLVADEAGREGWIQRRWLADDSTVASKAFERAMASAQERREADTRRREAQAAEQDFRNAIQLVHYVRETEKAIACEVLLSLPGGREHTALVWFPKSMCEPGETEGTALVPGWLIRDREAREAGEFNFRPRGSYEAHRFCKGERPFLVRGVEIIAA